MLPLASRPPFLPAPMLRTAALLALALVACRPAPPQQPSEGRIPQGRNPDVRPPETRAEAVVEVLHGVEIADPYRWLEDQESPETRAWIYSLEAEAHVRADNGPGALAALWKQALAKDADYFPALFNLGFFHINQKSFPEAETYLEKAAKADPGQFNAHYLLGLARSKQEDHEGALRAWRQALALQSNHVKLMQAMIVEYVAGRYHFEAAELAERAVKLQPANLDLRLMLLTAYRKADDLPAALAAAKDAAEKFPNSARAVFEYAWNLLKSGQFDEALPLIQKSASLDPAYEEPQFFLGDWLVNQGRYEEALAPLRKAIEIRPDYIPARVRLGRALLGLERLDEAVAELTATVEIEPRHPQPHLLLSQIYFRQKDLKSAAAAKRESLKLRRENPAFLEALQTQPFPE